MQSRSLERLSGLTATLDSLREEIERSGPGLDSLIFGALRMDSADRVAKVLEIVKSKVEKENRHIETYTFGCKDQIVTVEVCQISSQGHKIPCILVSRSEKEKSNRLSPIMFHKEGIICLSFEEFKQLVDGLIAEIKDGKEDYRLPSSPEILIYDKLFEYANVKYANHSGTEEKPVSSEKGTGGLPPTQDGTQPEAKKPVQEASKYVPVKWVPVKWVPVEKDKPET